MRCKQCTKYKHQKAPRPYNLTEVIVEGVGTAIFQNAIPAFCTACG